MTIKCYGPTQSQRNGSGINQTQHPNEVISKSLKSSINLDQNRS